MTYQEYIGELALGYQPTLWQEFKVGARYTDGDIEVASLPSLGSGGYTRIGGFMSYRLDTLDNFSLPTKGYFVDLEYLISHDDFDNDSSLADSEFNSESDTVYEISANFMAAQSIEKHTLVAKFDFGMVE